MTELDIGFLLDYPTTERTPVILKEEALLLYALCVVISPRVVVEIGSWSGASARCCLEARPDVFVAVEPRPQPGLEKVLEGYNAVAKVKLVHKRGEDVLREDIGSAANLVFLDASHVYQSNVAIIDRCLSEGIVERGTYIVQHDTGRYPSCWIEKEGFEDVRDNDGYHQPGEVLTKEFLRKTFPSWQHIDFVSNRAFRDGVTVYRVQ